MKVKKYRWKCYSMFLLFSWMMNVYGQGIIFQDSKYSWSEIKEQAKKLNKPVFVDCYTTWCGPCKEMDAKVYVDSAVGKFMNEHFISVKVQMDKTEKDAVAIKKWYKDAKMIADSFSITSYPHFVYLSPQGELLQKEKGFKKPEEFVILAKKAIDPSKNLSGRWKKYKEGQMSDDEMREFARYLSLDKQNEEALMVAREYKKTRLDKLSTEELKNKKYLEFIRFFPTIISTNDKFFDFIYKYPTEFDSIVGVRNYAVQLTNSIIANEYIRPYVFKDGEFVKDEPSWDKLQKEMATRFSDRIAKTIIMDYKLGFYDSKKDSANTLKTFIEQTEFAGIDTTNGMSLMRINNAIYGWMFIYSKDPAVLSKGIKWMEILLRQNPMNYWQIDTYAGLLYKIGRVNEAKENFQQAKELAVKVKDTAIVNTIDDKIEKINKNMPIW